MLRGASAAAAFRSSVFDEPARRLPEMASKTNGSIVFSYDVDKSRGKMRST